MSDSRTHSKITQFTIPGEAKRSKYKAVKTECAQGHVHDSKLEASRCDDLTALEEAGQIRMLMQQPEFPVIINGKTVFVYRADFAWFTNDCRIVEDVKGFQTPVFRLKRKLVEAAHPGTVITLYPPPRKKKRKARKSKSDVLVMGVGG